MDQVPAVIVIGAASRDLDPSDPRGWRLGGGVSYGSLTLARLGVTTGAVVGVDAAAAQASELDLLRGAGVDVVTVPLQHGPVFVNVERPGGRVQRCLERSDPVPVAAVPAAWRGAPAWVLAPVAAELPETWATLPPPAATVAVGWQGLLRELVPGRDVRSIAPWPSAIIARANLVGVSRDDLAGAVGLDALCRFLRPGTTLALTCGDRGGMVMQATRDGPSRRHAYSAVPSHRLVDATGAGDVFLAALMAARLASGRAHRTVAPGTGLLLAAAAASLAVEDHGLLGVPDRAALRDRIALGRATTMRPAGGPASGGRADPGG